MISEMKKERFDLMREKAGEKIFLVDNGTTCHFRAMRMIDARLSWIS